MSKTAAQQIAEIRAAADAKIKALTNQVLSELNQQLKTAEAEVSRIKSEIATVTSKDDDRNNDKPQKRQPRIEEGSDEWNKVANQIAIVLKNYSQGLNGKEIAYKMGKTEAKDIKRIQPVIQATCRREGHGVATRFFAK